ncbi:hydantoinase B/oxoprolinase family protein [Verrucomicrobiaceae bacterium E54]|nr:hydantoinase B/oxoprolinase family protein [Verrucomicrobiaceae bacterium E54]
MDFRVATTRGTNALLEHKGARVALFITSGFEDMPRIRDQRRADLFHLAGTGGAPLAGEIYGVRGRLSADGSVVELPDEEEVRRDARKALAAGCEVAAVALLHAWRNPDHEASVAGWLREEGFADVTLSSEVSPLIRLLPRMETALADAFLGPVMGRFVERVRAPLGDEPVWMMTSAGGLVPAARYQPKDSLLSGPAGGLIGAAELARAAGFSRVLTFDMGGTSTDVARVDGPFNYREEQQIGPARVVAPALEIETVAAGGGSICAWRNGRLEVGPESAGANPGPACYGRGGPLTLTDVNLLLGLMEAGKAGLPLDAAASRCRLEELMTAMRDDGEDPGEEARLLAGLRDIAVERMAEAIRSVSIRQGVEVADHALFAFGGAGPQHACAVAERLGVSTVLVPADAGLLSAWGLERARRQEQRVRQVLAGLEGYPVETVWREMSQEAAGALGVREPGFRFIASLRLQGQEATLELESEDGRSAGLRERFSERYRGIFGYDPPAAVAIELVRLRVVAEEPALGEEHECFGEPVGVGPLLWQDPFSTCVVPQGWQARRGDCGTVRLEWIEPSGASGAPVGSAIAAGLFRSRFEGILDSMGEALKRSALSTNIRERLDFSCALLDAKGRLVASAPHVPVHLGALGVCVRECRRRMEMRPGEVVITNHPGFGGSHLPDVTLIAPVHDSGGELVGFIANRAHHAEIGGMAPGSMPAGATCLEQEGVVIEPMSLVDAGRFRRKRLAGLLRDASYPSRRPADNLADVEAQLAACRFGCEALVGLVEAHGAGVVRDEISGIIDRSAALMEAKLASREFSSSVGTTLDDGSPLAVRIEVRGGAMTVDFSGSGPVHAGNLNATPAIVRSVLLYVLRLWLDEDLPLNEGLLEAVRLELPGGMLNPVFDPDPSKAPAVVGGNVELSQRLADLLCEAFGLCANGSGTMNNFLFGDESFGYYETLGGGSGAGPGFHGVSGLQVHMTNTALTDPEVIEHRHPVQVLRHALRRGSGGGGEWRGGEGIVREVRFLVPLTVSFLTQRRNEGPRGLAGGADGSRGGQWRIDDQGNEEALPGICTVEVAAGESIRIETPGGGGWGRAASPG